MRPAQRQCKNAPQALPAAQALIRHCRTDYPAAQLMAHRPSDDPSRSGPRQRIRRRRIFPRVAEARQGDMVGRQKAPRGKSVDTTG
jgi:hypothetical protein